MGTKWANATLLDNGPQGAIITPAGTTSRIVMHLVKAYSAGDSYATVTTTNTIANVAMTTGDFAMSGAAGAARLCTVSAKSGLTATGSSGASPNLQIAIVDTTDSKVLIVTDETSDQVVTSGNTVNIPQWTFTVGQPT